jgi:hypothetical protein
MTTANSERIMQAEVESQHRSSPTTVGQPTIIQHKTVLTVSENQQTNDTRGCNLEIDLSVVFNDLDSDGFMNFPSPKNWLPEVSLSVNFSYRLQSSSSLPKMCLRLRWNPSRRKLRLTPKISIMRETLPKRWQ